VAASHSVTLDDESAKQQLMENFAAQSGMNMVWARK